VLLTRELDETIRRAEIEGIRSGLGTVRRLSPDLGAASIEVAGGLAVFTGINSPLSQAYGVGVHLPLAADEIARITAFYQSRGATPKIFVTPLSDPALARGLAAAGYAPSEYENVLASDEFDAHVARDARVAVAADLAEWAKASARAFSDAAELAEVDDEIARVLASSDGVIALEARENGAIAATAAMDVRNGCAAFFAGSTLPPFRGRGFHLALIRDRIARSRDAGAQMMRATASPASASERNFHRCGFSTLYTRVLWERRF